MTEIEITSGRMNELIDPTLHIWGIDVAIYLFLGGIAAGLMIIPSIRLLLNSDEDAPVKTAVPLLLVSVLMSVGMFFLFLDLHHKLHVYRFYMTFQPLSPMSWGAWILIFVYPLSLFLGLSRLRRDYPAVEEKLSAFKPWLDVLQRGEKPLAYMNILFGVGLGIYTGILLSSFVARPLWNSGLLGVLFLVSGLSTGAALLMLLSKEHGELKFLSRFDTVLILAELLLISLFFIGLITSSEQHKRAAELFLGGQYTAAFWVFVVGAGLVVPFVLEILELRGKRIPLAIPAVMILVGGFLLRVIVLNAGQETTFLPY